MKDNITTNVVGVIPTGEVQQFMESFDQVNYDSDNVLNAILEKSGAQWLVSRIIGQMWDMSLKEKQQKSLKYFMGLNDSKDAGGDVLFKFDPFTGLSKPIPNAQAYYDSKISIPFHSNAVRELAGFATGSGQIEIKMIEKEEEDNKEVKETVERFSKKWNDIDKMSRELAEEYYIYSQAGVRWDVRGEKTLLGEEEFRLIGERIEPLNTWGFTFGRITNDMNKADVIVICSQVAGGDNIDVKFELYTNKAMYIINYQKQTDEKSVVNEQADYVRTPLWKHKTKEVDFLRPPFSFLNVDKYGKLLLDDYKAMIDKYDDLLNSSVDDSLFYDQKLLVIKGSDYSSDYMSELQQSLKALGKDTMAKQGAEANGYNAIYIPDGDGDVKSLDNALPTAHSEMVFKILDNKLYDSAGIIDYNADNTNENYNAIKMKYNKVLSKIEPVRNKLKEFVYNSIETLIVFMGQIDSKIQKDLYETYQNMFIEFSNSFLINELDQQNALSTGVGAGFISKKTAAEKSTFAASDEWERVRKEQEEAQEKMLQEQKQAQEAKLVETQTKEDGGSTTGAVRQQKLNN